MKRYLTAVSLVVLSACGSTAPIVKKIPDCEMTADVLAACEGPAAVAEGITFAESMHLWATDRDTLRACAGRHKSLSDRYTACVKRVGEFNADMDKMNAAGK